MVDVAVLGSSTACGKNLDQPMYGGQEGVQIWVSTPQPVQDMPPAALAAKLALRMSILDTYGANGLDFWGAPATDDDAWDPTKSLTDGVHPNAAGHALLRDVVVAADIPTAALTP